MTPDRLAAHLSVNSYGSFNLTDAIRPGPGLQVRPRQGYRVEIYRDCAARLRLPMLSAAVSSEILFEVFLDLVPLLGDVVHVVLESSHGSASETHHDFRRSHIDTPVLASYFCDFEELLTHDGCTGVAVLADQVPMELQFDEHKLIHVYAPNLRPFRRVLQAHGIRQRKLLPLISEAEHLHHTTDTFGEEFRQLAVRIGVGDFDRVLSDDL